jgi:hypothetical protein
VTVCGCGGVDPLGQRRPALKPEAEWLLDEPVEPPDEPEVLVE